MRIMVREKNQSRYSIHHRLGVSGVRYTVQGCAWTAVNQIIPFTVAERMPQAFLIAAVADGIISPVGLACIVGEACTRITVGPIVTVVLACRPGLVGVGTVVVTARAPAEEVNPTIVGFGNVGIVSSNTIPLVLCKTPSVRRSLILQVAL